MKRSKTSDKRGHLTYFMVKSIISPMSLRVL